MTVTLRDRFNNVIKTDTPPAGLTITTGGVGGTVTAPVCTAGVCTATYTAPAGTGAASIIVQIGGADVVGSPRSLTIN